ncbi:DUF1488 family protein [Lichenifustis flavocetrariae]|uniref:DUF1488 family protein n=1 Tax=Lichenifustis flavocetrariae TaxID=2949735 RepID=A0AA41YR19_9HYPH|nr:DUF1488 family protein [Lichenifustis flavocetrariae]MCW6506974.1 DUF1488 family protein [Lichenifustis flavocetrariae]
MPLTHIDEPGEVDAFGVRFTMEERGHRVRCHVFRSAITATADRRAASDADLLEMFQACRGVLERHASSLYDAGHRNPWIEAIVIRT